MSRNRNRSARRTPRSQPHRRSSSPRRKQRHSLAYQRTSTPFLLQRDPVERIFKIDIFITLDSIHDDEILYTLKYCIEHFHIKQLSIICSFINEHKSIFTESWKFLSLRHDYITSLLFDREDYIECINDTELYSLDNWNEIKQSNPYDLIISINWDNQGIVCYSLYNHLRHLIWALILYDTQTYLSAHDYLKPYIKTVNTSEYSFDMIKFSSMSGDRLVHPTKQFIEKFAYSGYTYFETITLEDTFTDTSSGKYVLVYFIV